MTEKDKQDIAEIIGIQLERHRACPHGISTETAAGLKEFAETWRTGKKAVLVTVCTGVITGIGGLIVLGLAAKIKSWLQP
ncbi:MAG: hypothetical protein PHH77_01645 [Victivallaceae bacterium]|nr:hypothetical protein [Victivallaceae bacterium]